MTKTEHKPNPQRQYPAFYEKIIPISITVLGVIVVGVMLFALGVALGIF